MARYVIEWGMKEGCEIANLNTREQNPARGLFERMGFQVVELGMHTDLEN